MKVRFIITALLVIPTRCLAQEYVHERVAWHPYIHDGGISDWGAYWYSASEDDSRTVIDLYVNGTNYSESLLPGEHGAAEATLMPSGDIVWLGAYRGDDGRFRTGLYINDLNYSAPLYGEEHTIGRYRVNSSLRIALALSIQPFSSFPWEPWLDGANVSRTVLGEGYRSGWPLDLTEDGTLYWVGQGPATEGQSDVFRDDVNLSAAVLGAGRVTTVLGFARNGQALWIGAGSEQSGLFVDTFNLAADALDPFGLPASLGGAVGNAKGQILWFAEREGMQELWLSTPVPEPSALLFALPLLQLRRRK